jgi:transmembrane sensor
MDEAAMRKLVEKYLGGACTEEEKNIVESWYSTLDIKQDSFMFLSDEQKEEVRRTMLSAIKANIHSHQSERPGRLWLRYLAGAAAVLAVVMTFVNNWRPVQSEIVMEAVSPMITVVNAERSIQRVSLPDSSTLWLQPGAEVIYPGKFNQLREVTMKGDVFFEVHRDVTRPFVVYSSAVVTRVLGTSFRVRTSGNERMSTVSVLTGKVSVRRIPVAVQKQDGSVKDQEGLQEVLLLPYERVLVSDRAMVIQKNDKTGKKELEMWRKTTVSFDNVIVKEVLGRLSKLFEVQISTPSEKINRYLLKADFTGMNLPDILEILESSLDITYEINGDQIVLKPLD